ncbi:MAG: SHD1 domain-containing protein [Planctomycetota bacterium]
MNKTIRYFLMSATFLFCAGCSSDTPIANDENGVDTEPMKMVDPVEEESASVESPGMEMESSLEFESDLPEEHGDSTRLASDSKEVDNDSEQGTDSELTPVEFVSFDPDSFVNCLRVWRDSENLYSTKAELVAIGLKDRQVRLLKDNGVAITVSYDRLSSYDQKFINEFLFMKTQRRQNSGPSLHDILVK